jgi:DNA-binding MarR family transcriptional regulator
MNVYTETEALFQQSSSFFEKIHAQGELSMARRGVLLSLLHSGPQTVPQLAHAKSVPVSRQYMQRLVNQLAEEGHVEFIENVKHKRSSLVQLTNQGRTCITTMLQREIEIVTAMEITFSAERLQETAEMLRAIRIWQKDELGRLLQMHTDHRTGADSSD